MKEKEAIKETTKPCDCCDVMIAGGGIAGISAALAAARQGASVLLIEASYILGGLATSGLVTIYLPLCDGTGRQVSYGICEELIRLSIKHGAEDKYSDAWFTGGSREERSRARFEVQFNPHLFALEAEKLLREAGVKILYGTRICGITKEESKLTGVVAENKSGRCIYSCCSAVDCTGDADLFAYFGAQTAEFEAGNVLASWYYYFSKGRVRLKMLGCSEDPNDTGAVKPLIARRFCGLDGEEISEMMQLAHEQVLKDIIKQRESDETYLPVTLSSIPQLRMTRKIIGPSILDITDEHKRADSSVGMVSNWRKSGPVYEIPFETLYSETCKNLFAAGRCISVTDAMWDISRVIPVCAVTGQAAGTAAAMLVKAGKVDVSKLQQKLEREGVKLHECDLEF